MSNKISEITKKIPLEKVIYPAITLLFAAAVLISFNKTIFFITENINKAFSSDESSIKKEVPRFDAENYELIRKRFNWPQIQMPAVIPEITLKEEKPEAKKPATTTETVKTPEKPAEPEEVKKTEAPEIIAEKSLISISIFNGSEISGAAEKLKASLTAAGFETTKIEARQLSMDTTIIQTKPVSKKNQKYITEIKQIVSKEYSPQISADLSDSVDYEVMIIIGKK